ncbi:MAG: CBS domain-containing protein [Oscillospiraceae bacterium]|nr:CBS domain-containing protein [Oscillospiraceae bacterium]
MLVKDVMTKNLITANQTDSSARAARLLYRHNIGSVAVLGEGGKIKGIVTDRDLALRCIAAENDPEETSLQDVMSRCVITCEANDSLEDAVKKMENAQIRRLPVTDNGKPVGMLTLGDIAKRKDCTQTAAHALSEISSNLHKLS